MWVPLRRCTNITDKSVDAIADKCRKLRALGLKYASLE